jgi:hypothetical protein
MKTKLITGLLLAAGCVMAAPRISIGVDVGVPFAPAPVYVAPAPVYAAPAYLPPAPVYVTPAPVYAAPAYAPAPGYVWVNGFWGGGHVWHAGYWRAPHRGYVVVHREHWRRW